MFISRYLRLVFLLAVAVGLAVHPYPGESGNPGPARSPVNPQFVRYFQEKETSVTSDLTLSGSIDTREGDTKLNKTGAIPSVLFHPRTVAKEGAGLLVAGSALPSAYDLRDEGRVTSVRDQLSYGTCWAFGVMGSIESYLKRSDITSNLAEYHLAWWAYNGSPSFTAWDAAFGDHHTLDQGGNAEMALAMLSRWSGAVKENDCPYDEEGAEPSIGEDDLVIEHLQNAYYIDPGQTSVIKKALMEYGAVNMMIIWNDDCYDEDEASYYMDFTPEGLSGFHSLVIVGWNDNYPRTNFSPSAPLDGAWIVRNSWGPDWGEDGYFWLSYANTMTEEGEAFIEPWVFLSEPSGNYTRIYQYDPLGWVGNMGYSDGSDAFANIFKASGNDVIEAVSFYTPVAGSSYRVKIFTELPGNSDPRNGILHSGPSGTLEHAGYHTITLNSPVSVVEAEYFSVVVELSTPGYDFPIPLEDSDTLHLTDQARSERGQSFVSDDGSNWHDLKDLNGFSSANVCLKAFANSPASYTENTLPDQEDVVDEGSGGGGSGGSCSTGYLPISSIILLTPLIFMKGRKQI